MTKKVDEDEHSIEMQIPFLAHVLKGHTDRIKIVPILVGNLNVKYETEFGKLLAPYFADPQNFFVISSDFCHWGSRFDFTYTEKGKEIYEAIENLDRKGMALIEKQDADGFAKYLNEFSNTICGRHPIGVLLRVRERETMRDARWKLAAS
jgi:AmmeMemoRadiSam system protein B